MKLYAKHIVAKLFSVSILKIKLSPKLKMSQKLFDLIYFCFSGFTWIEIDVSIFYRFWIFLARNMCFGGNLAFRNFTQKSFITLTAEKKTLFKIGENDELGFEVRPKHMLPSLKPDLMSNKNLLCSGFVVGTVAVWSQSPGFDTSYLFKSSVRSLEKRFEQRNKQTLLGRML